MPPSSRTTANASQSPAVVVDLDNITGLQTARILANAGIPVFGVAGDPRHFSCRTRVCQQILYAQTDSVELLAALEKLGGTLAEKAVLFPCSDRSVLFLSRNREAVEPWFHLVLPDHDVVETLLDKRAFYTYAEQEGFPVPRTMMLHSAGDAERAAETLRFPCVLKPPVKTVEWENETGVKAYKISDRRELVPLYRRTARLSDVFVIQEWVEGGHRNLFTCNCYFDARSEPVVTFVTQKLRQWPPDTGTGSLGVESRNDVVAAETVRLFKSVAFRGLGYLEMKRDASTGDHLIVEANVGRPTGRSATAEAAGVELLRAQYCDVLGLPLPAGLEQRYTGAKWIYFGRDARAAISEWRRGELGLRAWWKSVRGVRQDAVFSWRDPLPFVFDVWRGLKGIRGSPT
jgi:predicted ATP-grasp superfamily ATP-dependent carboligase